MLTDRLAADALSLASAFGRPMDDADWKAWRQGERGLFARRARALLDRNDARALKQMLEADPEFAGRARAYAARFDALLRRVGRDGATTGPLAVLLLSSEPGRLAAALTEVLGD
jgi:hypothetical protein